MDKKDSRTNNLSQKEIEELRRKNPDINIPDKDLRIDSFNTEVEKFIAPPKTLKEVKKILGLKDQDIAEMFGYSNAVSYRNSERRNKIDNGIIKLYQLIEKKLS